MKDVHFLALKEITSKFGDLQRVDEENTNFQLGWTLTAETETITFNFTLEAIRIFNINPINTVTKLKSIDLLKQCAKKSGLRDLVFYEIDPDCKVGGEFASTSEDVSDGLILIGQHFNVSKKEVPDELGGCLMRIGSRKR